MTVDEFITYAKSQVGNNGQIYWNWYADNINPAQGYYINGYATPYCAEFVSCMLLWNSVPCIYFPNSCAFDSRDIPISQRYYAQSMRRGDIISFDWDKDKLGDHVGIITDVFDWGCQTIEGNTGTDSGVHARERYWDDILFSIRPIFEGQEKPKNNTYGGKLDIDGIGGFNTVLDMQNALGTYKDGTISGQDYANYIYLCGFTNVEWTEYGSEMVYSLQEALGIFTDGIWGKDTSYYLQEFLLKNGYDIGPCGADTIFGNDSVKALQRYLNDGGRFR